MHIKLSRAFLALLSFAAAIAAHAGTLEVSNPTEGGFVGRTNTINFIIRGASVQVTVRADITGPGGTSQVEGQFNPDVNGEITGTLPLNFSGSNPQGAYQIVVSATEPNNTYNTVTINVILDTEKPKFQQFNPLSGAYVKGIVPISVQVDEANIKEMKVQINGEDIPDNVAPPGATSHTFTWDTTLIEEDGEQTITIKVKDKANNEETKTIDVTLDRIKPTVAITYPSSTTQPRRGANLSVVAEVQDASANSVHGTAIDVIVTRMDGSFITRVAVIKVNTSGSKLIWSGRVRWRNGLLPSQFKIVANAVDKAGNVANTQTVVVTLR